MRKMLVILFLISIVISAYGLFLDRALAEEPPAPGTIVPMPPADTPQADIKFAGAARKAPLGIVVDPPSDGEGKPKYSLPAIYRDDYENDAAPSDSSDD